MTSRLKVTEIADPTNGNTAISIDSNGDITFPNRKLYHWHAWRSGTSVGVNTDVIFNEEIEDPESIYNHTTGIVTIPVTGVYQINFFGVTVASSGNDLRVGLYDSSNNLYDNITAYMYTSAADYLQTTISLAKKFDANDTVKLRVTGGTLWSGNGSGAPHFSGYLVG